MSGLIRLPEIYMGEIEGLPDDDIYNNVKGFLQDSMDGPDGIVEEMKALFLEVVKSSPSAVVAALKGESTDSSELIVSTEPPDQDRHTEELYSFFQVSYDHFNKELFENRLPNVIFSLARKKGSMGSFTPGRWATADSRRVGELSLNPSLFAKSTLLQVLSIIVREMVNVWRHASFTKAPRKGYYDKKWAGKMIDIGLIPESKDAKGGTTGQSVVHKIARGGLFISSAKTVPFKSMQYADRFDTEAANIAIEAEADKFDYDKPIKHQIEDQDRHSEEGDNDSSGLKIESVLEDQASRDKVQSSPADDDMPDSLHSGDDENPLVNDSDDTESIEERKEEDLTGHSFLTDSISSVIPDIEPTTPKAKKKSRPSKLKYSCPECSVNVWGKHGLNLICGDCNKVFISPESPDETS
jgi:hypothetical protein